MKQYKGVKAKVTKKTCETWTYPGHDAKKLGWRLHHNVWKNWCPFCYKTKSKSTNGWGVLKFNPKNTDTGELTCSKCDADFDCVDGWEKSGHYRKKLKKGTLATSSSNRTKASSGAVQTKRCDLTRAEAKLKAGKLLNIKPSKTWSIDLPLMSGLYAGDYININNVDGYENGNYFINNIKEDLSKGIMTLNLLKGRFHYGQPYKGGQYIVTNAKGGVVATSSKNPFKAKSKYVNKDIGITGNSTIEKKIMLKGKQLGTVKKCYKWLMADVGTGKFKYKHYTGHYYKVKSDKVDKNQYNKLVTRSLQKCWENRFFNCVDGSFIFYLMCKGCGVKISIISTHFKYLTGDKGGHMYNYCKRNGKYYDVTNVGNITPTLKKVQQIK